MRDGARDELDRVMRLNLPDLTTLAVRLTGTPHRAEELVQETMVRAVRHWHAFRGESSSRTWLYKIAINVFRDKSRSRSSKQEQLDYDVESTACGPEQQSMASELEQEIARQVSTLPARQREVLVLITYEGMNVKEVGKVLNMKPSNVYASLHYTTPEKH